MAMAIGLASKGGLSLEEKEEEEEDQMVGEQGTLNES